MQTHIAQMAALTIYGNEFLRGRDVGAFWPSATVFQFCRTVRFVAPAGAETAYADDPTAWLARLRDEGVLGLRLHYAARNQGIDDRMAVAFAGGGGRWLVEARKAAVSDVWEARWEVGDRDDPERRIWKVTYGRTSANARQGPVPAAAADRLHAELRATLDKIARFARARELAPFAAAFRRAMETLESDAPLGRVYHTDLAPAGALPLAHEQLLAVAQQAWVFGGMGSWNDVGMEAKDRAKYDRLSQQLFGLLTEAVVTAANASYPSDAAAAPPAPRPRWRFWK